MRRQPACPLLFVSFSSALHSPPAPILSERVLQPDTGFIPLPLSLRIIMHMLMVQADNSTSNTLYRCWHYRYTNRPCPHQPRAGMLAGCSRGGFATASPLERLWYKRQHGAQRGIGAEPQCPTPHAFQVAIAGGPAGSSKVQEQQEGNDGGSMPCMGAGTCSLRCPAIQPSQQAGGGGAHQKGVGWKRQGARSTDF